MGGGQLDAPRQETIAEILRRTAGKSIGVLSDAEIEDATPAAAPISLGAPRAYLMLAVWGLAGALFCWAWYPAWLWSWRKRMWQPYALRKTPPRPCPCT